MVICIISKIMKKYLYTFYPNGIYVIYQKYLAIIT